MAEPQLSHISHSSTGNLAPVVDKVVGSAYDVVREVAYNLEYIKHVSAHLEQIYSVADSVKAIEIISQNLELLENVYANITEIIIVANNIGPVVAVGENISSVIAIAGNIDELVDLHEDLPAILSLVPYFATRDLLVAHVAANPSTVTGRVYSAAGLQYVGKAGSTAIPDLPGMVPMGFTTPEHFNAKGDATTDDSNAFIKALAYSSNVYGTAPKRYMVKNVVVDGAHILDMRGATLAGVAGAKWIIRLTGYEPGLINARFDDYIESVVRSTTVNGAVAANATAFIVASATGLEVGMLATVLMTNGRWHISPIKTIVGTTITVCRAFEASASIGAAVDCSWGMLNIRGAYRWTTTNIIMGNTSFGVVCDHDPLAGLSYMCLRGTVEGVQMDTCRHVGWFSGRNCADTRYDRMSIRGGVNKIANYVGNDVQAIYTIPYGAWLKSDVTVTVAGVTKAQPTHWTYLSASQLQFTEGNIPLSGQAVVINVWGDAKSGLCIDPTGWTVIRGGDTYSVIECLGWYRGIEMHQKELTSFNQIISDTCAGEGLYIDSSYNLAFGDLFLGYAEVPLKIIGNASNIFFEGPTITTQPGAIYLISGVQAPIAIDVNPPAYVFINAVGWRPGSVKTRNLAGGYEFMGATVYQFSQNDTVAVGTTVYFGPTGASTVDRGNFTTPRAGYITRMYVENSVAAGAGSYSYMLRNHAVDTTVAAVITGSTFSSEMLTNETVGKGRRLNVRIASAGGAPACAFRGYIEII